MSKREPNPDLDQPAAVARKRDVALLKMLKTPPKKHADDKKPRTTKPTRPGPLDPWKPR